MGIMYINNKPLDTGDNGGFYALAVCDSCNEWANTKGGNTFYSPGETLDSIGEAVAWFCADCLRS